ncbi:MAG: type 4a pilus biogenesis protein PilO [Chitinivibrionales bacterium]|nr:type 4a pilus biogenesis protein PilO [Chitinivibrionales bacterium]
MKETLLNRMEHEFKPFLVVSAAVLVALFAAYRYGIPQLHEYLENRQKLVSYKEFISQKDNEASIRESLKAQNDRLTAKLEDISYGLANAEETPDLLQMLITKARNADISFTRIEPEAKTHGTDFIHYPVILEMSTRFHSLGKFIASLEEMPQVVRVDRLSIGAEAANKINVLLNITCFFQLEA